MMNTSTYLRWSEAECTGLTDLGIAELLTEVDSSGVVTREIGLDLQGRVVHIAPSPRDNYGFFDNQPVELAGRRSNDLGAEEFEALWVAAPPEALQPRPSLLSRLLGRARSSSS